MWICLARFSFTQHQLYLHCMYVELVQQHGQQDWMVRLPVCFTSSLVIHTCLNIPVLTTANRDTYIRRLLFLVPTWMTAGFPQTSITSPEVAIWWSSCQVYSYPHSSNNPLFISLSVFLAFTLFRKADVGVPSHRSTVIILPLHSAFSFPFGIIWWHISLFKTMEAKRTYGP